MKKIKQINAVGCVLYHFHLHDKHRRKLTTPSKGCKGQFENRRSIMDYIYYFYVEVCQRRVDSTSFILFILYESIIMPPPDAFIVYHNNNVYSTFVGYYPRDYFFKYRTTKSNSNNWFGKFISYINQSDTCFFISRQIKILITGYILLRTDEVFFLL